MGIRKRLLHRGLASTAGLALLALGPAALIACGDDDGEDRPDVNVIDDGEGSGSGSGSGSASGSVSGTGTGSASGSASGTGTGSGSASGSASGTGTGSASGSGTAAPGEPTEPFGGYTPVSDVTNHARVVLDVADINALLSEEPYDFDAILEIYETGVNSPNGDSFRSLGGFARTADRSESIWDDYVAYYDDPTWLNTFVEAAITGTGPFEGESDAARRQGVQKGVQYQIMIAWTIHELVAAQQKVEAGEIDPASGAPHNWDEAWAFYHGADPSNAPFAVANSRGENFGTGTAVNDAILDQMNTGLAAVQAGDAAGTQAAVDEIIRQITITYVQASIRYGTVMDTRLAEGDTEGARVAQAEGWSFFRVIEPLVAQADPEAAATIVGIYDLEANPELAEGSDYGGTILAAFESAYEGLGIDPAEVGELQ